MSVPLCDYDCVFHSLPLFIWRTPNMFSSAVYLFHGRSGCICGLAVWWVYWIWRPQWWTQLSCVLRVPVPVRKRTVYRWCPAVPTEMRTARISQMRRTVKVSSIPRPGYRFPFSIKLFEIQTFALAHSVVDLGFFKCVWLYYFLNIVACSKLS